MPDYRILTVLFFYILCFLYACNILAEVDGPVGSVTNEQAFSNESTADASVMATYYKATETSNILNGAITIYTAVNADEVKYLGLNQSLQDFYFNNIKPEDQYMEFSFWTCSYAMMHNINDCLKGLNESRTLTQDFKKPRMAECKFLRALIYFHLVQLFGEVPLIVGTDLSQNITMGRSKMEEINNTIIADLQDAQENLPEIYPSGEKIRANKWAATALLARFYLYRRDWQNAYNFSSKVIESGAFKLHVSLDSVFLRSSTEAIFQLQSIQNGYNCIDAASFIPSGKEVPPFCLTDSLLKAFDPSDKRFKSWLKFKTVGVTNYYYPYKFKIPPTNAGNIRAVEFNTIIRLAEMFLIRAEAGVALHLKENAVADVNIIRKRAGLSVLQKGPDISELELSDSIQQERRREFFAECGHRWFDLKRTGKMNDVLNGKIGWQPEDTILPVPSAQIIVNPHLTQNPGY